MVGHEHKWQRRLELFQKQTSADPVILSDGAFLPQMENVWAVTIQKMFSIFGIVSPALYDPRVRQYIDEVVDKRNAVGTVGRAQRLWGKHIPLGGCRIFSMNCPSKLNTYSRPLKSIYPLRLL
jgi:hypothetical protein